MSARLNIVCVFVVVLFSIKVTEVELCEMLEDDSLEYIYVNSYAGVTRDMFTKCVKGTSSCSNCVPTGYELVNVTYVFRSQGKELMKLAYRITGCECVAKPPLNALVAHKTEKSYMYGYKMMSYCTYALGAVCAVLGLIIVVMCMRYEIPCSKKKKSEKVRTDEQTRPLAVKQISQEENV